MYGTYLFSAEQTQLFTTSGSEWLLAGAVEAQVHEIEGATVFLVQRLQRNYSLNVYKIENTILDNR